MSLYCLILWSKGIQIIYPIKRKYEKNTTIEGQNSLLNSEEKEQKQTIEYLTYRATYVYDISQTVGESLPMEDDKLNTNNNIELFNYLKSFSPFPIKEIEIFVSLLFDFVVILSSSFQYILFPTF